MNHLSKREAPPVNRAHAVRGRVAPPPMPPAPPSPPPRFPDHVNPARSVPTLKPVNPAPIILGFGALLAFGCIVTMGPLAALVAGGVATVFAVASIPKKTDHKAIGNARRDTCTTRVTVEHTHGAH